MEKRIQYLDGQWFARTEAAEADDLSPYYTNGSTDGCIGARMPLLAEKLFPLAKEPLWFYHTFRCELTREERQRIYICFDQVICLCEVWVNGVYAGKHIHSEEKFSFDITDALKPGENLLACRIYGPVHGKTGPDGISMHSVPNFAQVYSYYTVVPKTGIYGAVSLRKRPLCAIRDLYVRPDRDTKTVSAQLTFENRGDRCETAQILCQILDKGAPVYTVQTSVRVDALKTAETTVSVRMDGARDWSPEDPCLYDIHVTAVSSCGEDSCQKRFGFKTFCVENGWFMLNGKRIWLSCAHAEPTRRAVVHAKAMGFKALRFLAAMPSEELLDFCDEIGLMVYEECAVSWGMSDYPDMPAHMAAYLDNMILRDRSHVSVSVWGIFNEQSGPNEKMKHPVLPSTSGVFDFAVSYLPRMRRLDDTRLILLSSGRWDARLDIGSFSNPGSSEWCCGWGGEAPDCRESAGLADDPDLNPYMTDLGDVHLYPTVPIQNNVRDFVRTIGRDTKPVFLSEYGVGYQLDLYGLYRDITSNSHPDHPYIPYYAVQIQRLEEWITLYGLSRVYPCARDFLKASIAQSARQRRESIDPVRANPRVCGYSLTSFSLSNEGVYYRDGSFVPGVTDALRDSFAPLKWSIFTESSLFYAATPFEVEIVLCNEDVLPSGEYAALVSVTGKDGVVWTARRSFVYPQGAPLAAPVMRVTVPGLAPGEYTFSVQAEDFRQPSCGEKTFAVADSRGLPLLSGSLYLAGDTGRAEAFLKGAGMTVVSSAKEADAIIIGSLAKDDPLKTSSLEMAKNGKKVYVLDPGFWENANTSDQEFMQSIDYDAEKTSVFGECIYVRNWLYHLDSYIADKDVFAGLAGPGIVDMERFRKVYPDRYLINTGKPAKTFCASFGSGLFAKDNCIAALTMGEFTFGSGSVVVNTFKLIENIGSDPAADRILYNLLAGDQKRSENV